MKGIEFVREMRDRGFVSKEAAQALEDVRSGMLDNPGIVKRAAIGARLGSVLQKLMGAKGSRLSSKVRFGDDIAEALGGATKMDDVQKQRVFQSLFEAGPGGTGGVAETVAHGAGKTFPFVAGALAIPAADAAIKRRQQDQAFEHMLEVYPDLQQADPADVQKAFSVVSTYAPSLAKDPIAAGAAVSKFVEFDTIDPAHLKQLLEIEGRQRQIQPSLASELSRQLMQGGLMGE